MGWKMAYGTQKLALGMFVLMLAALVAGTGCSKKKTPPQPLEMNGVWMSNHDESRLVIREKSRFVMVSADQPDKKIRGALRLGGGKAIFRNAPDSQVCVGVEGIYTPKLEGQKLSFEVIKDDCSSRRQFLTQGFKRPPRKE